MIRRRAFLPCLIGAVLTAAGGEVRAAADRIVEPDGTVHRVSVVSWPPDQMWSGTAIRYTRQAPDGHVSSALIPGTDDYNFDREPALAIDPVSGQPIVVWSRFETVGSDLYVVTIRNAAWSEPRPLLAPNPGRTRPRVKTDASLVHVFWTHVDGNASRVARASFLPGSLALVLGPEPARVDCATPAPTPGTTTGTATGTDGPLFDPVGGDPPTGDTYFAAEVPAGTPGGAPLLGVWGVRDEPVPIDFRAAFSLPYGASNLSRVDAAMIAGRLTVWFEWSGGLWYTFDDGVGRFTPLRVIKREAGGYTPDALVLLRELIDRLPPATP